MLFTYVSTTSSAKAERPIRDPGFLVPEEAPGTPDLRRAMRGLSGEHWQRMRAYTMSWIDQRPDDAMAGAFEAIGPEPVKTVDPALFRESMSRLGAAVHVVTTAGPAGRTGFTATAVCSVSDAPPTLLVCLNRKSRGNPVLRENGVFCVNTLGAEDEALADLFAGRTGAVSEERFQAGEWSALSTGAPVLRAAVVAFDCRTIEVRPVATHNVYFAAVEAIHLGPPGEALVYHERAYKRV